ncbi:purine permease [Rossellomorea vietnamensis]|uniref:Purine permease n=1 Tax=Rossellomorea vietnamensis TaxID=218284 RepID=A0A5D4NT75_9BACI|nr:purine/pyrimidine permease [Rossellomorea vietnamensis]TYS17543.1 purine permease [Rossellomorea vietnamensis]
MKIFLTGLQWMAFMVAGSIAAPIAIADLFNLPASETAGFIQRTMFVLGAAGVLQALIGHRMPINEGPAGLWWGVFAIYAGFVGTIYGTGGEVLQLLQGGMLVSGLFFFIFIFAVTGGLSKLTKLFTPTITFIYLLLLIFQLSGSFIKGMFGLSGEQTAIDLTILAGSLFTFFLTLYLSNHKVSWIKRYSIIFSLIIGWLVFILIGKTGRVPETTGEVVSLPGIFVFGLPEFDLGIIITSFFITLLLITNMIASIRVMEEVMTRNNMKLHRRYNSAGTVSGINQVLGGLFSAVGSVPISGAAGFVSATGILSIIPFVLGASLVVVISLFPDIMNILATLPAPVGYAVTYVIFINMVGLALGEYKKEENSERSNFAAGVALIAGVGLMFVPPSAFEGVPAVAASILNNGLIIGTIAAIAVEQVLIRKEKK